MAEYIEREAALRSLEHSVDGPYDTLHLFEAKDRIEAVPAADVKPAVRGQWIEVAKIAGISVLKCSVCGKEYPMLPSAFCRDCGAKMEEAR